MKKRDEVEGKEFEEIKDLLTKLDGGAMDSLRALSKPLNLSITDLSSLAEPYLTESTKNDLTHLANSLIVSEDGEHSMTMCFGLKVVPGDEESAIKKLSAAVNQLSEENLIHSFLCGFTAVPLIEPEGPKVMVVIYPLVPSDVVDDIYKRFTDLDIRNMMGYT